MDTDGFLTWFISFSSPQGLDGRFELKNLLADAQAISRAQQAVSSNTHIGAEAIGEIAQCGRLRHWNQFAVAQGETLIEGIGEIAFGRADKNTGSGRNESTSGPVADENFLDGKIGLIDRDGSPMNDESSGDIRGRIRQLSQVAKEADADAEFLLSDDGFLVLDAGIHPGDAAFIADIDLLVMHPQAGVDRRDEGVIRKEQLSADAAYLHFLA